MTSLWLLAFVSLVMILTCYLCIIYLICHNHLASDVHCFGCCPFSPYDVSNIAHEETPIVSSYILGDFDSSHSLHDPDTCVHHMLPMNKHAINMPYTCILNLCPHCVIHNNYSFMMDDMFLYHASNFFERFLLVLTITCTYTS